MAATSDLSEKRSRGRPSTGGQKPGIMVRMPLDELAALDEWIGNQPDPKPSRPEAVRRHVQRSLDHCASAEAERPRSVIPHEVTGKDKF